MSTKIATASLVFPFLSSVVREYAELWRIHGSDHVRRRTRPGLTPRPYPGTPRWMKVFGIIVIFLVLLVVVMMFIGDGEHGPARHILSGDIGGHTPPLERWVQQP